MAHPVFPVCNVCFLTLAVYTNEAGQIVARCGCDEPPQPTLSRDSDLFTIWLLTLGSRHWKFRLNKQSREFERFFRDDPTGQVIQ